MTYWSERWDIWWQPKAIIYLNSNQQNTAEFTSSLANHRWHIERWRSDSSQRASSDSPQNQSAPTGEIRQHPSTNPKSKLQRMSSKSTHLYGSHATSPRWPTDWGMMEDRIAPRGHQSIYLERWMNHSDQPQPQLYSAEPWPRYQIQLQSTEEEYLNMHAHLRSWEVQPLERCELPRPSCRFSPKVLANMPPVLTKEATHSHQEHNQGCCEQCAHQPCQEVRITAWPVGSRRWGWSRAVVASPEESTTKQRVPFKGWHVVWVELWDGPWQVVIWEVDDVQCLHRFQLCRNWAGEFVVRYVQ